MFQTPSLIEQIVAFLFRPKYQPQVAALPWWRKLWEALRAYNFFAVLTIISIIVSAFVISQFTPGTENELGNLLEDMSRDPIDLLLIFFMIVIYGPIIEEMTFRVWLRATTVNLSVGFGCVVNFILLLMEGYGYFSITGLLLAGYEQLTAHMRTDSSTSALLDLFGSIFALLANLFILLGLIGIFFLIFRAKPAWVAMIGRFFEKYFPGVFYASSLLFGLAHITNYSNIDLWWLFGPLLVLPQILGGLVFGFVRVQWGVSLAILIHALNNSIPFIIILLRGLSAKEFVVTDSSGVTSTYTVNMGYFGDFLTVLVILGMLFVNLMINTLNFVELFLSWTDSRRHTKHQGNNLA